MKKLLYIVLLFSFCGRVNAQVQGTMTLKSMPSVYNSPSTQQFSLFLPSDYLTAGHKLPLEISMNGQGEVGTTNFSGGSIGDQIMHGATTITWDAYYSRFTTRVLLIPHKPSGGNGSWETFRIKDMLYYAKHDPVLSTIIDTTQIIVSGLSLGGGGALAILGENISITKQISAVMAGSPTGEIGAINMLNLTNSLGKMVIFVDAITDDNATTRGFGGQVWSQRSFSPWNTYPVQPFFIMPSSGGHSTGWIVLMDSSHRTIIVDSTSYHGGNSAWANRSYFMNPNSYERALSVANPVVPPTLPPPCTSNISPANASTVAYAATATLNWAFVDSATSYDVYLYVNGGSVPGSPTANVVGTSYNATGLTGSLVYKWFIVPRNAVGPATGCSTNFTIFTTAPPGTIDSILNRPVIYDHSSYTANDVYSADNFFDGIKVFNPLTNTLTDTTSPNNPQHGWDQTPGGPLKVNEFFVKDSSLQNIYYPGTRGPDVWLDMVNYADLTDTARRAIIRQWVALSMQIAGVKAYLYNGDSILRRPRATRLFCMAHMDSIWRPVDSMITTGNGGLITRTFATPLKARWLVLRLTQNSQFVFNTSEMTFIGQYTGAENPALLMKEFTDTIPLWQDTAHTFTKVNGINDFGAINPFDLRNYGPRRNFTQVGYKYYNNDSTHWGVSPNYEFWNATDPAENVPWMRSVLGYGTTLISTLNGAKYRNAKVGYGFVNIDTPRISDPELTESWKNAGTFAFNIAAKFGKQAISSGRTRWTGDVSYPNGLGFDFWTGFGNEDYNHGYTLRAIFAKKNMEWDGDEGRAGSDIGTRAADTTFRNGAVSCSTPDTNYIKVMKQLASFTRVDKKVPFNWIDMHYYISNKDSSGNTFLLATQVGMRADPFEWMRRRAGFNGITYWQRLLRTMYKYVGVMPVVWSEWGIGNDTIPASTEGQAAGVWDIFNCPTIPGYNNYQSKGTYLCRYNLAVPFTGLYGSCNYTAVNNVQKADTIASGLFQTYGMVAGNLITYPFGIPDIWKYAQYYMTHGMGGRMRRYRAEGPLTIIGNDSTGIWTGKYRNIDFPDSVCTFIYYASKSGFSATRSISLPGAANKSVEEWIPSFTTEAGNRSTLTAAGGFVTRMTNEIPHLYFYTESGTQPAFPYKTWIIRQTE